MKIHIYTYNYVLRKRNNEGYRELGIQKYPRGLLWQGFQPLPIVWRVQSQTHVVQDAHQEECCLILYPYGLLLGSSHGVNKKFHELPQLQLPLALPK